ncbi:uncharacterized protein LOC112541213 [Python bivittatus]|uniref:Uncharacterized protein LOC112541213 n=1 Tax=Python bivittatus TaxID=176946 RepID=A0A9F5MZY1_PYTBI|nr:uncharacterized protein LOC112541213 [Python bivittatus]
MPQVTRFGSTHAPFPAKVKYRSAAPPLSTSLIKPWQHRRHLPGADSLHGKHSPGSLPVSGEGARHAMKLAMLCWGKSLVLPGERGWGLGILQMVAFDPVSVSVCLQTADCGISVRHSLMQPAAPWENFPPRMLPGQQRCLAEVPRGQERRDGTKRIVCWPKACLNNREENKKQSFSFLHIRAGRPLAGPVEGSHSCQMLPSAGDTRACMKQQC